MSNLRQLGQGLYVYLQDNNDRFPQYYDGVAPWYVVLGPYINRSLSRSSVLVCSSNPNFSPTVGAILGRYNTYAYATYLEAYIIGLSIRPLHQMVAICDAAKEGVDATGGYSSYYIDGGLETQLDKIGFWHSERANFLFGDGHVSSHKRNEVTISWFRQYATD